MDNFKDSIKKGFQACKSDIESLNSENSSLKKEILTISSENSNLKSEIFELKKQIIELREENKDFKNKFDNFLEKFDSINKVISNSLSNSNSKNFNNNNNDNNNSRESNNFNNNNNYSTQSNIEEKKEKIYRKKISTIKDPYEALLNFKARANKREMLKKKIVSMVSETPMDLKELRYMFVEHYRYSSKATFYNYIRELEAEKNIRIERDKNKNYVYFIGKTHKDLNF